MPSLPVSAVFFAQYTVSNYRALYRRFAGPPKIYTKDYFQLADQAEEVLAEALGFTGEPLAIEYAWPGGSIPGELRFSSDRLHLTWPTGGPQPWRVGDPADGVTSIQGDPTKATIAEAEAEFKRIEGLKQGPWLVGVVVADQPRRMHVRVYFEVPPAGLEDRKVANLPAQAQAAMQAMGRGATGALKASRPAPAPRAAALVQQIEDALARNPSVLLIGPPGTGKTVALEDLVAKYAVSGTPLLFDTDKWGADAFSEGQAVEEKRSESLVFHPSYSYENFVAGLYPKATGAAMELQAIPGPLIRLGHWIGRSSRKALLVLDEFNRGQAAAIFGDTLGLLDKDKRTSLGKQGAYIARPYADFPMQVSDGYASYGDTPSNDVATQVTLPVGLSIVAAMNSTDRSVAPLDAALRRRFHVIRVLPDYAVLAQHFGLPIADLDTWAPKSLNDMTVWEREDYLHLAIRALRTLNERIRFCLGEDFLLGHALLWSLAGSTKETALAELASVMDGFLISTLRTTFLDQDDVLAAVLGISDNSKRPANPAAVTEVGYWDTPPAGLDKIASRRLVLHSLPALPAQAQLASLVALAKQ